MSYCDGIYEAPEAPAAQSIMLPASQPDSKYPNLATYPCPKMHASRYPEYFRQTPKASCENNRGTTRFHGWLLDIATLGRREPSPMSTSTVTKLAYDPRMTLRARSGFKFHDHKVSRMGFTHPD